MGMTYFGPIFGIACLICYKNPGMLKPFMKFVQSYASETEHKYKDL